jgi:hypothetical protein
VVLAAGRALYFVRFGGTADELLKVGPTIITSVFVDWHIPSNYQPTGFLGATLLTLAGVP